MLGATELKISPSVSLLLQIPQYYEDDNQSFN